MPDLPQRHVVVTYRRQLSDGNYGTESAEVTLDWWIDQDNDSEVDCDFGEQLLNTATGIVMDRLRFSLSDNVRRAATPPRPITPSKAAPTTRDGEEVLEDLPF